MYYIKQTFFTNCILVKISFYLDDEDDDKNDDFVSPSSNKWMSDLILFLIFCWT